MQILEPSDAATHYQVQIRETLPGYLQQRPVGSTTGANPVEGKQDHVSPAAVRQAPEQRKGVLDAKFVATGQNLPPLHIQAEDKVFNREGGPDGVEGFHRIQCLGTDHDTVDARSDPGCDRPHVPDTGIDPEMAASTGRDLCRQLLDDCPVIALSLDGIQVSDIERAARTVTIRLGPQRLGHLPGGA